MEVKNKKISFKREEKEFRQNLKKVLNNWFGIKLKDLPKLITKLGITDKSYKINFVYSDERSMTISVKGSQEIEIRFFTVKMIYEYAFCLVTKGTEKPEVYQVSENTEIQTIEDFIEQL